MCDVLYTQVVLSLSVYFKFSIFFPHNSIIFALHTLTIQQQVKVFFLSLSLFLLCCVHSFMKKKKTFVRGMNEVRLCVCVWERERFFSS